MIKLLTVATKEGIPVYHKILSPEINDTILAGLLGALETLSELLVKKPLKTIETTFDKNKLLVIASKKGILVAALTSVAEEYIKALLKVIAEEIDMSEEISYVPGFVTLSIKERIRKILDKFISDKIEVTFSDIISKLWKPILNVCISHKNFADMITRIKELKEKAKIEALKSWNNFVRNIRGTIDDAINYALAGDFAHACAIAIKIDDDIAKIFAVKTGLLAYSQIFSASPPLEILEEILRSIRVKSPFLDLLECEIKVIKNEMMSYEYIQKFKEVASKFEFIDDRKHLMLSFVFFSPLGLRTLPDFAQKLCEFFRNKSNVIYAYLESLIETAKFFSRIYTITKYDDIKNTLTQYRMYLPSIINELSSVLRPSIIKRILGLTSQRKEINKTLIKCCAKMETILLFYTILLQSPALDIVQKKEIANEVIRVYYECIRKCVERKLPILYSTLLNSFQAVGVAYTILHFTATKSERLELIRKTKEILRDMRKILESEPNKIGIHTLILMSPLAAFNSGLDMHGILDENAFMLTYALIDYIGVTKIEMLKRVSPYDYAAVIMDFLEAIAPFARHFLEGKTRIQVLKEIVKYKIAITKWLLSQAKMFIGLVIAISWDLLNALDELPEEAKSLVEYVISLAKIAIPDIEKHDHEFALSSEILIKMLIKAGTKLNNKKYLSLAKSYADLSERIWKKYGFIMKANEISEFKRKIPS